jgi:hypothetical protein
MTKEISSAQAKIDEIIKKQLILKKTEPQTAIDELVRNNSPMETVIESRQGEIDKLIEELKKGK